MQVRARLRTSLEASGWYLRRLRGLPTGLDLFIDLKYRFGANLSCVFDVGAHRGETVCQLRQVFPHARVFAFEPVSSNFSALSARYGGTQGVTLFPSALGAVDEKVRITLQQDSQTHSLRNRTAVERDGEATEELWVRTLDDVVREASVDAIDLLKIDTEGCELEVLRGAEKAFGNGIVHRLVCEASLDQNDVTHSQFGPVLKHVAQFGFQLVGIYDQVTWPGPLRLAYFNALFVRS